MINFIGLPFDIKASTTFFVSMALPSTVLGVRVALCKRVAAVLMLCFSRDAT